MVNAIQLLNNWGQVFKIVLWHNDVLSTYSAHVQATSGVSSLLLYTYPFTLNTTYGLKIPIILLRHSYWNRGLPFHCQQLWSCTSRNRTTRLVLLLCYTSWSWYSDFKTLEQFKPLQGSEDTHNPLEALVLEPRSTFSLSATLTLDVSQPYNKTCFTTVLHILILIFRL